MIRHAQTPEVCSACRQGRAVFVLLLALVVGGVLLAAHIMGSPIFPAAEGRAAVQTARFDHEHAAWTDLLGRYVRDGVVDYAGLNQDGQPALNAYLEDLETAAGHQSAWPREQRLAYWINAYNAYTVRLILDNYPLKSIRSIGLLPGAAFRRRFIPLGIGGAELTLDDIEHRTLRPEFEDARIHFAIVCASISCPPLQSQAFRASDIDAELDAAARQFLTDETRNRLETDSATLFLSSIFDWFREDFERDAGSLEAFVSRFLSESDAAAFRIGSFRIRFLDYDWSLNGR